MTLTSHMIASSVLLDVHTAVRAWFGSHFPDSIHTQLFFCLLRLITAAFSMRLPRPVTLQTDLVVAVGTCDQLLAMLVVLAVLS